jgi:hypothetical protein
MNKSLLHGEFSDPSYITVGDPFVEKKQKDERAKGKQFITAPPKKGHNTSAVLFEKEHRPLSVGHKYMDQFDLERVWRKAAKKGVIGKTDFRPSSVPKKLAGPGSYIGTFGGTIEYIPGGPKEGKSKEAEKEKPNFKTNPPKKGSFGVPGITFGKLEYVGEAEAPKKERAEGEQKLKPFKASFPDHTHCFTENIYKLDRELPPKRERSRPKDEKKKIFRPTKPSYGGTINRFPEYKGDPYRLPTQRKEKQEERAKPGFRLPSTASHSGFTRSIAYHVV